MPAFDASKPMPVGSYPDSGISVLIVGTGLAGLTAAIECVRKGHRVRVLEKNDCISSAGDMYFMGLSATKFFKHWPAMAKRYDEISMHNAWIETYKHDGTLMVPALSVAARLRDEGLDPNTPPGTFQMRPLVYRMFVDQLNRLGVEVTFGQRVVSYWEDADKGIAGVETAEGVKYQADVVIAADGVGSKSQKLLGGQVRAALSGRAMWRAAFPVHHLDKDPKVKEFFKMHEGEHGKEPIIRTWLGPGGYAMTLTREDTMVWIVNHPINEISTESWSNTVEVEDVLHEIDRLKETEPWADIFKDLIKVTPPKTIIDFALVWRDPQPKWASPGGLVVNIGDAAHSFLPASGNGATQAIEDAVSLASCLQIGGRENIAQSVRAHVRMRFIRNACAQRLGFFNAQLLQNTKWEEVGANPRLAQPKLPRWVWEHDPEKYAYEVYDRVVESMRKGVPIEDDDSIPPNYPPGYKYKPWTLDEVIEGVRKTNMVDLGPGNWD